MQSDRELLTFIHDRLAMKKGESQYSDYMWRLRFLIETIPDTTTTWNRMVGRRTLDKYRGKEEE